MWKRLYEFEFVDRNAKWSAYGVMLFVSIGYAAFNEFVLRRPEARVAWESVAIVAVLSFALPLRYALRSEDTATVTTPTGFDPMKRPVWAALAAAAALILVTAVVSSVDQLEAAVVDERLRRLAGRISPGAARLAGPSRVRSTLQDVSAITSRSLNQGVRADQAVVHAVRVNVEDLIRESVFAGQLADSDAVALTSLFAYEEYLSAAQVDNASELAGTQLAPNQGMYFFTQPIRITDRRLWFEGNGAGLLSVARPAFFIVSNSTLGLHHLRFQGSVGDGQFLVGDSNSSVVVHDCTLADQEVDLDSIIWLGVEFQNCILSHSRGPIYLGNARFKNCHFERFILDPAGKELRAKIESSAGAPISFIAGLRPVSD